jgi:hypothetical protein
MGHEDAVYLAKLAEQAERYEGMLFEPASPTNHALTSGARAHRRDGREHEDCRR